MLNYIQRYSDLFRSLSKHDDDIVDRLNYKTTSSLLLVTSLLLFARNYVGEPLQCWVPRQFTGAWEKFSEQYCFIENTYYVSMRDENLPSANAREDQEMIYYQWVPFILVLMGLLFAAPRAIWSIFPRYSGLSIAEMAAVARGKGKLEEKVAMIEPKMTPPAESATSLFNWYLIMKTAILLNVAFQFFGMNHFLGTDYTLWGLGIFWDLFNNREWHESGHFPRVAFCDVTSREMANIHHWTLQCVLMVNMFNEKIFIFLWFWLGFVLLVTLVNYLQWIHRRFSRASRAQFLADLLDQEEIDASPDLQRELYRRVLRDDGVLYLRLIDSNCGRLTAELLIRRIWKLAFEDGSNASTPVEE